MSLSHPSLLPSLVQTLSTLPLALFPVPVLRRSSFHLKRCDFIFETAFQLHHTLFVLSLFRSLTPSLLFLLYLLLRPALFGRIHNIALALTA